MRKGFKKKKKKSFGRTLPNLLHSFIVDVIYLYCSSAELQRNKKDDQSEKMVISEKLDEEWI